MKFVAKIVVDGIIAAGGFVVMTSVLDFLDHPRLKGELSDSEETCIVFVAATAYVAAARSLTRRLPF